MNSPWLKSDSRTLSFSEIGSGSFEELPSGQEKNALQFCRDWLNGQSEFYFNTSGSTGIPAIIKFTREQLTASAEMTIKTLNLLPGTTALAALNVRFIAGAMMLVRSMHNGMNIIVVEPSSNPLKGVEEDIAFAAFVPLQMSTMIRANKSRLNRIKTIILGGAEVSEKLANQLKEVSGAVYATYGMTETITHIALQRLNGPDRQECFHLLPGISISTDSDRRLIIKAAHLGGNPVLTNDIVSVLDEKRFRWEGRADRTINSGGIKIQAELVESKIRTVFESLEIKNRFFITALSDEILGHQVALVLEGTLDPKNVSLIKSRIKTSLNAYEMPRSILTVDRFAETATMKIDRPRTLQSIKR